MLDKVEYLGTTISATGISPTAEKVQTIKGVASLTDVSELQSLLELDLSIFYLNLCRILQSWLRLCTDYFVRRYIHTYIHTLLTFPRGFSKTIHDPIYN